MTTFKHGILALLLAVVSHGLFAQKFVSDQKGSAIGFSGNLVDFSASVPKIGHVDPGYSIMYWKGLSSKLDLSLRYNGLFSDYSKLPGAALQGAYKSEGEASLHLHPTDSHILLPFLTAGIGVGGMYSRKVEPYVPLGGGLQLNLLSEGYVLLQANYRASLNTTYLDNNMFYSLGVLQTINY